MGKKLRLAFQSGHVFEVPAKIVAEDRAAYYAEKDTSNDGWSDPVDKSYDDVFEAEREFALNDELELRDWLLNNMDWEDIEDDAELVERPSFDPSDAWGTQQLDVSLTE